MSILKTIYLQHLNGATPNATLDANGNMTVTGTIVAGSSTGGMRNKIINGAMVIDQRNGGAAVNANGGNKTHPVDRFYSQVYNTTGNTTGQQSTTAPTGFTNSLKISVLTADTSVGSTDQVWYGQDIEGFNVADLGFGTSGASFITLSFWVYSNVTGTYCVTFKNSAENRGYTAEYTINASNTWEKKTITVPGDTTGTWVTNNGTGLKIWFILMAGSSQQTTANTWNATSGSIGTSNQVNFMSSLSNVFYLTGVQLEVGTVATPFERRLYGAELSLCQRYYQLIDNGVGKAATTTVFQVSASFVVEMRTTPSSVAVTTLRITDCNTSDFLNASPGASISNLNSRGGRIETTGWSGLTSGSTYLLLPAGSSAAPIRVSAEL